MDSQKKPHVFNTTSWRCPPWRSRHCCHLPGALAMTRRSVSCVTFAISWRIAFLRLLMSGRVWVKTWAFKYPHKKVCCSKVRWIGGQRACAPSVDKNGRATLCAQQLIPGRFAGWKCKSWCKIRRTLLSDKFQELEMPPHWTTWTPLQGYSHTLDIFRWPDGVSTGTGFNLYGSSLTPLTHPLTNYFPWRCSPTLPIITKFPTKLSLHWYDRLA